MHWSDASTVEALVWLARRRDTARLLVLGTYRPVELILRQHPLKAGKQELQLYGHCANVPFGVSAGGGGAPPSGAAQAQAEAATAEWAAWVHRRTEGQPFFMVHVVEELARQGTGGSRRPTPRRLGAVRPRWCRSRGPAGQLIELQLGQLDTAAQQVLEVASVVGAEFAEASVAAGLAGSLDAIAASCDGLARQGQFIEDRGLTAWPDGTVSGRYGCRHALYQEMLYRRLGSGRRMRYHRAIGMRLEAAYGAGRMRWRWNWRCTFSAGKTPTAVQYRHRRRTGAAAVHLPEANTLLTGALTLLAPLPETPARGQDELPCN